MKQQLSLILVITTLLIFNIYIYWKINRDADIIELESSINDIRISTKNSLPTYNNQNDIYIPTQNQEQSLTEIVISPDDIWRADLENSIGSHTPYNSKYITRDEVIESIERILGDQVNFKQVSEEYQQYLITLRNVEMIEHITEDESNVLMVAKEYMQKLGPMKNTSDEDKVDADKMTSEIIEDSSTSESDFFSLRPFEDEQ